MWLKLGELRAPLETGEECLPGIIAQKLGLPEKVIQTFEVRRKSLDARHKDPVFVYSVAFQMELSAAAVDELLGKHRDLTKWEPPAPFLMQSRIPNDHKRPVIVGSGPAGLFAGLRLAAAGLKPLIIERGDGLPDRIAKVNDFWNTGRLDPESNIQYGIGGAGTFSDGKLTTRIKDPYLEGILEYMVNLGAPREIVYWQRPHIGTDLLRDVVSRLQQVIIEYGGEILFRHGLTGLNIVNGRIASIQINHQTGVETDLLILAIGNSARDTYEMLYTKGLALEAKPFAVGLRIEHPQEIINQAQYGKWFGHPRLGPAEYLLTYQDRAAGRGVYTFCMCPGGYVVGAASEPGGVVTNGMSYYKRNSEIANAAIVVTVNPHDYGIGSPLAGIEFQRDLERHAFEKGGANFYAPAQRVADFMKKEVSGEFKRLKPSYLPGVTAANLWDVLPENICSAINNGIKQFGRQIKDFDWPDAVLTGVETRTSAPVRILRGEDRQAIGIAGIYPAGEGSGYAGGIISSALDGWRTAEMMINSLNADRRLKPSGYKV